MADTVHGLPRRGFTFFGASVPSVTGASARIEGTKKDFADVEPVTSGPASARSGDTVTCRLVRNSSGITLAAKRVVKWKSGYRNLRVDGYCSVDFENVAGVVDDKIPSSGVADGDLFWLMQRGPALVKTSLGGNATNVITEGSILAALTSAASTSTTAGRVQQVAATSSVTAAIDGYSNRIGRAMSAKTTANTNADVLVDLDLLS